MRLSIRPFSDTEVIEGRVTDRQRDEWEAQVRKARLEVARLQQRWEEIPAARLVQRSRYLVDTDTDLLYTVRRGSVWESGKATIGFVPNGVAMTYTVDGDGDVVFLELGGPRTWTELAERRARRGRPS